MNKGQIFKVCLKTCCTTNSVVFIIHIAVTIPNNSWNDSSFLQNHSSITKTKLKFKKYSILSGYWHIRLLMEILYNQKAWQAFFISNLGVMRVSDNIRIKAPLPLTNSKWPWVMLKNMLIEKGALFIESVTDYAIFLHKIDQYSTSCYRHCWWSNFVIAGCGTLFLTTCCGTVLKLAWCRSALYQCCHVPWRRHRVCTSGGTSVYFLWLLLMLREWGGGGTAILWIHQEWRQRLLVQPSAGTEHPVIANHLRWCIRHMTLFSVTVEVLKIEHL